MPGFPIMDGISVSACLVSTLFRSLACTVPPCSLHLNEKCHITFNKDLTETTSIRHTTTGSAKRYRLYYYFQVSKVRVKHNNLDFRRKLRLLRGVSIACFVEPCIVATVDLPLSVRLSVTRWHCVKTTQARVTKSSPTIAQGRTLAKKVHPEMEWCHLERGR